MSWGKSDRIKSRWLKRSYPLSKFIAQFFKDILNSDKIITLFLNNCTEKIHRFQMSHNIHSRIGCLPIRLVVSMIRTENNSLTPTPAGITLIAQPLPSTLQNQHSLSFVSRDVKRCPNGSRAAVRGPCSSSRLIPLIFGFTHLSKMNFPSCSQFQCHSTCSHVYIVWTYFEIFCFLSLLSFDFSFLEERLVWVRVWCYLDGEKQDDVRSKASSCLCWKTCTSITGNPFYFVFCFFLFLFPPPYSLPPFSRPVPHFSNYWSPRSHLESRQKARGCFGLE